MKRVTDWYISHQREFPFRKDATPYHIWVSEIMLQQTRMETVLPYYERFIKRLPDIRALAEIPDDELMKLWQGLGYYSRARNMKKTALLVMEQYGGNLPASFEQLEKLPGIGRYTAAAVASMAFNEPVPVVDGNVLRVLMRYLACFDDVLENGTKKKAEQYLKEYIDRENPDISLFNQGMMELGETVCLPAGEIRCDICPLKEDCQAYEKNLVQNLPVRKSKIKKKTEEVTVLLIEDQGQKAVEKRSDRGLLAGLYGYPVLAGHAAEDDIREYLKNEGLDLIDSRKLPEKKHVFTHIIWKMNGYRVIVRKNESEKSGRLIFASPDELRKHYALPSAFLKWEDEQQS